MNNPKKFSPRFLVLVLSLCLMAMTVLPVAAGAEDIKDCRQWHTVQPGEYLTMIAKMYGTDWRTLVEINHLEDPNLIFAGQKLCVALIGSATTPSTTDTLPNTGYGIRVFASSVKEDQTVTLQGAYLVADTSYTVYLSNMKANQPTNFYVGTISADANGTFKVTYAIPKKLYDVVKIRVIINNGKGDTASNWFYNMTAEGNTGGTGAPALGFTIVSVTEDKTVKIQAYNLMANVTYQVVIGKAGTMGENGVKVGEITSTKGGTVTQTFEIPSSLRDRSKLDICVENTRLEIVAFKTFENKNQ